MKYLVFGVLLGASCGADISTISSALNKAVSSLGQTVASAQQSVSGAAAIDAQVAALHDSIFGKDPMRAMNDESQQVLNGIHAKYADPIAQYQKKLNDVTLVRQFEQAKQELMTKLASSGVVPPVSQPMLPPTQSRDALSFTKLPAVTDSSVQQAVALYVNAIKKVPTCTTYSEVYNACLPLSAAAPAGVQDLGLPVRDNWNKISQADLSAIRDGLQAAASRLLMAYKVPNAKFADLYDSNQVFQLALMDVNNPQRMEATDPVWSSFMADPANAQFYNAFMGLRKRRDLFKAMLEPASLDASPAYTPAERVTLRDFLNRVLATQSLASKVPVPVQPPVSTPVPGAISQQASPSGSLGSLVKVVTQTPPAPVQTPAPQPAPVPVASTSGWGFNWGSFGGSSLVKAVNAAVNTIATKVTTTPPQQVQQSQPTIQTNPAQVASVVPVKTTAPAPVVDPQAAGVVVPDTTVKKQPVQSSASVVTVVSPVPVSVQNASAVQSVVQGSSSAKLTPAPSPVPVSSTEVPSSVASVLPVQVSAPAPKPVPPPIDYAAGI